MHQKGNDMELEPQQGRQTQNVPIQASLSKMEEEGTDPRNAKIDLEPTKEATLIQNPNTGEDSKGTSLDPKSPPFFNSDNKDECVVPKSLTKNSLPISKDKNTIIDGFNMENCMEIISTAIPSVDLNCDGCCPEPSPLVPHPICPYNLISQDNKPNPLTSVGGIELSIP